MPRANYGFIDPEGPDAVPIFVRRDTFLSSHVPVPPLGTTLSFSAAWNRERR